jgi:soluble lytic murein transglycosylase
MSAPKTPFHRQAGCALALALLLPLVSIPAAGQPAVGAPARAAANGAATDAEFLAAKAAFDRQDAGRLATLAPRFAGHLLEPYVEFWGFSLRLAAAGSVPHADFRRYAERWPDSPLVDRLRSDWLKAAGKRADWSAFALEYPPAAGEDTELACYGIQYRRQRDGDAALAAAKPLYFTEKATPDACEPLFAALIAKGELSTADRVARFRLAVEAGNLRTAQAIGEDLPGPDRIAAADLRAVDRNPLHALDLGAFRWRQPGGRAVALYALERTARTDAGTAHAAWVKHRVQLPEADRAYGNARVAYHGARQLEPRANGWFREASGAEMNEAVAAWRVRAALRAGSWPDVAAAIDAMPAAQAQDPAWRYWKARSLAAAGRNDEANARFAALAPEHHFYGVLAAEALGQGEARFKALPAAAAPVADAALAAFGAQPGVRRTVKLAELDLRPESLREWVHVVRGMDDEKLLLAATYAQRAGLYDRAINTADRTSAQHDFALRYLMPYREQFAAAAREQDLDRSLLFGLARQESRFIADIVSSAGASGLMQLMPATARWVAKQMGEPAFSPAKIADPALNTRFGAFYFRYWLDRLDRMPALAAAAYNAGPGRAQAWRGAAPLEGAVWAETIPFNETRDYVKKVLANTMYYAQLLGEPYVPLTARLSTIAPRNGGAVVSARAD